MKILNTYYTYPTFDLNWINNKLQKLMKILNTYYTYPTFDLNWINNK